MRVPAKRRGKFGRCGDWRGTGGGCVREWLFGPGVLPCEYFFYDLNRYLLEVRLRFSHDRPPSYGSTVAAVN